MAKPAVDLYLGDAANLQGYRVKNFTRDSAPLVTSRFSTGRQSQSDLDLLKVESVINLGGGQFQRNHEDPTKVARVIGAYNRFDQNVYPTVPRSAALSPAPFGSIQAKAENSQYVFASFSYVSGGVTTNSFYYMNAGATGWTAITLPAALASGAENVTGHIVGLVIHRGYVYIGSEHPNGSIQNYRYNIVAGTFQAIGGISSQWAVLRGVLYTINKDGSIYSCTNEFAAGVATYTLLDTIGNASVPSDMKEYNGAIWLAKPEGIFRFDGVKGVKVLDHVTTKMQVFNGSLYFVSGNWLYRFDGASVTRLQFFADTFGGFAASTDYLFIATTQQFATYQTADKPGLPQSSTDFARRIYTYDGVGFYMLDERTITNSTLAYSNLYYTGNYLFDTHNDNGTTSHFRYELDDTFIAANVTSASKLDITISEFDDGFPAVFKSLEYVQAEYEGMISGDSIVISYQYHDGIAWSAWQTLGTLTSTTTNRLEITDSTKKLFKKLKISAVATFASGSTLKVGKLSWYYSLQPRVRWRWQTTLAAHGVKTKNRSGVLLTDDANLQTNNILKSVKQKTPIYMTSPDYGRVKTTVNSAATSFIIKGQVPIYTDPYSEYPLVAVKNASSVWEIFRVSGVSYTGGGTDETTITVIERGYLGITAASLNADAEFRLIYKVYATRLLRDQNILDDNTYNEQATSGESQLEREFMLEITEV